MNPIDPRERTIHTDLDYEVHLWSNPKPTSLLLIPVDGDGKLDEDSRIELTGEDLANLVRLAKQNGLEVKLPPDPPHPETLTNTKLASVLVGNGLIDAAAVNDPDGYDGGVTFANVMAAAAELRQTENLASMSPPETLAPGWCEPKRKN